MNKDLKRHLISAGITFGSSFALVLSMAVVDPAFSFTWDALYAASLAALIAGVRAVAKLVIEMTSGYGQ